MNIIRDGRDTKYIECPYCGSEMEYSWKDTKYVINQIDPVFMDEVLECPKCIKPILIHKNCGLLPHDILKGVNRDCNIKKIWEYYDGIVKDE